MSCRSRRPRRPVRRITAVCLAISVSVCALGTKLRSPAMSAIALRFGASIAATRESNRACSRNSARSSAEIQPAVKVSASSVFAVMCGTENRSRTTRTPSRGTRSVRQGHSPLVPKRSDLKSRCRSALVTSSNFGVSASYIRAWRSASSGTGTAPCWPDGMMLSAVDAKSRVVWARAAVGASSIRAAAASSARRGGVGMARHPNRRPGGVTRHRLPPARTGIDATGHVRSPGAAADDDRRARRAQRAAVGQPAVLHSGVTALIGVALLVQGRGAPRRADHRRLRARRRRAPAQPRCPPEPAARRERRREPDAGVIPLGWRAMSRYPSAAVIGAGSSGIAAAKALHEHGVPFTVFEASDRVGGNWVFGNRNGMSAAYRQLHINTSRDRMEYSDFPMPKSYPDYPHHTQIAAYFDAYVDHFGLRDRIRFETKVEHARRRGGGWDLELHDGTVE